MRKCWIVCYDVSDPKRWRRIYRLMRGYGDHVQLSVFRCVLSGRELAELRGRLEELASKTDDHVLLVDLGPAEGRGDRVTISIGKPLPEAEAVVKVF
jgi:CRISPR-associated protein Cas2